jgi:hypothetical protein
MKLNDNDIVKLLEKMKDSPELGGDFDTEKLWNRFATENGFPIDQEPVAYGVRDYLEFYVWQFSHAMVKPLVASVAVFLLLFAGWVWASNASYGTLPGDRNYPLKLSLEKVQLALAFNPSQKAKLQVEFTSRRLEEMVELAATAYAHDPSDVRFAVEQFKKEVQTIRADLKKVEKVTSTKTELAKKVRRINDSTADLPEEAQKDFDEVQTLLEETKDEAVEVIITAHESTEDATVAFELAQAFEKELTVVKALDLSKTEKEKVELAVTLQKEGAYRRAFQLLKEIKLNRE